jgi:hypothetical protein
MRGGAISEYTRKWIYMLADSDKRQWLAHLREMDPDVLQELCRDPAVQARLGGHEIMRDICFGFPKRLPRSASTVIVSGDSVTGVRYPVPSLASAPRRRQKPMGERLQTSLRQRKHSKRAVRVSRPPGKNIGPVMEETELELRPDTPPPRRKWFGLW